MQTSNQDIQKEIDELEVELIQYKSMKFKWHASRIQDRIDYLKKCLIINK